MHWLHLTNELTGQSIWINLARATSLRFREGATVIYFDNDNEDLVKETPEEIFALVPVDFENDD